MLNPTAPAATTAVMPARRRIQAPALHGFPLRRCLRALAAWWAGNSMNVRFEQARARDDQLFPWHRLSS